MRLITSIVVSMSALFSLAQSMMPIQHDTLQLDQELIVSGIADFSSTSLQNELMQKLFYGGEITFGIKNRSFIDHKGINRFGADISGEVEYRNLKLNLFKNPNWVAKCTVRILQLCFVIIFKGFIRVDIFWE